MNEGSDLDHSHSKCREEGTTDSAPHMEENKEGKGEEAFASSQKSPRSFRKFLSSIKESKKKRWRVIYCIPLLLFVVFALILGDNNLYNQFKLSRRIHQLEKRIDVAEKQYRIDKSYLDSRQKDDTYDIETLGRRKYGLKKEGEMVFLLIDTTALDYKKEERPLTQ